MVEIAFSPSSTGNLKAARAYGYSDEIKHSEILWFDWMMDIGYLDKGINSEYRKNLPGIFYMNGDYGEDCEEGIPELGETSLKNWGKLKQFLKDGEDIRVWYSDSPYSLCGFYHLCTLFRDHNNTIYRVKCPDVEKGETMWYPLRNWGRVQNEKLGEYTSLTREIPAGEICVYAERWDMLSKENYPLRAVISGIPTSVNEDFYDIFLDRYLPADPIKQSEWINITMSETDLGVYSFWYEYRIQKMIKDGKVKILEGAEERSDRILQRIDVT